MEISSLVSDLIREKRCILFCGAGISLNSGIPSVHPLLHRVLSQLGTQEAHIKLFLSSVFPFEATMENINERVSISSLLKIFNLNNPNQNHNMIAWMAKRGYVNTILTTNFDENIEISLLQNDLVKDKDYFVITELNKFKYEDFKEKIVIIKLHGNIENIESIMTTISKIANKRNAEEMKNIFSKIFESDNFDNVLFMGYSFSDHFDIGPALMNIPASKKNVYYIHYQSKGISEGIVNDSANPRFSKFKSTHALHCNFETIVSNLYATFPIDPFTCKENHEWITTINSWVDKEFDVNSLTNRNICLGYLFLAAGFIHLARHYAELKSNSIEDSREEKILKMLIEDVIGKSFLKDPNERDASEATKHYIMARQLAEELELEYYFKNYSGDLGSCYLMQQNFPEAEKFFDEALTYFKPLIADPIKKTQILERYCRISIHLAHSYAKRGAFPESQVLYNEIIQICSDEGFTSTLELAMTGNGLAHVLNGHQKEGLEIFISAYPIAKVFGSIDRVRSLFFLVCSWTREVKGILKAKSFYDDEIEFIREKTGFNRPFEEIPERLIKDYKYK